MVSVGVRVTAVKVFYVSERAECQDFSATVLP